MISWGGEPRGWDEKQGRLPGGGAVQLRPESREVSHKGMGKAVQGRGLDVQRSRGGRTGRVDGEMQSSGGPSASGGDSMKSEWWVEIRSEEEGFLACSQETQLLRCHTARWDEAPCPLGWATKAAQNRLFNLLRGQKESALSSFGAKGSLCLVCSIRAGNRSPEARCVAGA